MNQKITETIFVISAVKLLLLFGVSKNLWSTIKILICLVIK